MGLTEAPTALPESLKPESLKPEFPPGREFGFFGETKRSKQRYKEWKEREQKRKELLAIERNRKLTIIEQKEKGLR